MKDGDFISVICKTSELADDNFIRLHDAYPGLGLVEGLHGNELLIRCGTGSCSLNQIRETVKGSVRIDMFELATDERTGEQYRNWYYLPPKKTRRITV